MVLVQVRLVLGPLGPVPARGRHAHLRPPSCQKNAKSVMPGARLDPESKVRPTRRGFLRTCSTSRLTTCSPIRTVPSKPFRCASRVSSRRSISERYMTREVPTFVRSAGGNGKKRRRENGDGRFVIVEFCYQVEHRCFAKTGSGQTQREPRKTNRENRH